MENHNLEPSLKGECTHCKSLAKDLSPEMYKAAGVGYSKKTGDRPYLKTSVWRHTASRLPWLIFLVFAALLAGLLVTYYEQSFLRLPILVAFIPMLMGIAGAGGSQSATVIIRSLAIGELTLKKYFLALLKELWISLLCGAAIAVVGFAYIIITEQLHWQLGLVLGLGLMATIVFAKLLGITLPMLAKLVRIDPALISSPLVTIIADIFGIFIYFTFAQAILGI
ncbi:MAG: magnesium transporter [Firmicutes bacterium]|nr:magnesium transporter [Bacillota bacterium]